MQDIEKKIKEYLDAEEAEKRPCMICGKELNPPDQWRLDGGIIYIFSIKAVCCEDCWKKVMKKYKSEYKSKKKRSQ